MNLEALLNYLVDIEGYTSNLDYYIRHSQFVHEDGQDLTEDIWAWVSAVPWWGLERVRTEYEKNIPKSYGNDLFVELTYRPFLLVTDFPVDYFVSHRLENWFIWFTDFVEYGKMKVILRLVKKEDMTVYV